MGIFQRQSTRALSTVACAGALCAAGSAMVPESMQLTRTMKKYKWTNVPMIPLDLTIGVKELPETSAEDVIQSNLGSSGSIAFIVRRPGCILCREHGQQLMHLAADNETKPLDGFELFGVVKETGVDDEGLVEFQNQYFPFPLYKDVDLKFYDALGNGSVMSHVSFNPLKIYSGIKAMNKRLKDKKLEGNMVGEGMVTGGLIIFGSDGSPKYMAPETTGSPLDEDDLLAALASVRNMDSSSEL